MDTADPKTGLTKKQMLDMHLDAVYRNCWQGKERTRSDKAEDFEPKTKKNKPTTEPTSSSSTHEQP